MNSPILIVAMAFLLAEPPVPRNKVPHSVKGSSPTVSHEDLDKLRATSAAQQQEIEGLRREIGLLKAEVDRLRSAEKPAGESVRPRPATNELRGAWKLVSAEEDGKPQGPTISALVFGGGTVTFKHQDAALDRTCWYQADPEGDPKEIAVLGAGPRPILGIYALQGAKLTLCIDRNGTNRPVELASKPGTKSTLWVLERAADDKSR